MKLFFIELI
ncbi:hypothetical protein HU200_000653 [Digitaria exilis]|uniref:Uncharacterized protein n=1 Tax=Digitaria exilis TaxID=1010633 RepID=A0A835KX23_9POAL|nr:hypothetical protein HU200_000653 [Digitaria exilis]